MRTLLIMLLSGTLTGICTPAMAQSWNDAQIFSDPVNYYANRNGTYQFQHNPNNNMGTSPNNASYKNEAAFYNKDNYLQTNFPTANGVHYTPGSLGNVHNISNFNNNPSGTGNYQNVNNPSGPVYLDVRNEGIPVRR